MYELDAYRKWLFAGLIRILRRYAKNGTVLEIGCAKGYLVDLLGQDGYFAIGGDISRTALSFAKKKHVVRFDGEIMPFKNSSFDSVIAVQTLEHLPNPADCIKEIYRIMKDKGFLLVVTPEKNSPLAKLGYRLVEYTALKNPYHAGLMSGTQLANNVRESGFKHFKILPFHNGFLAAPLVGKILKQPFIPLPIDPKCVFPFLHHQMLIAYK